MLEQISFFLGNKNGVDVIVPLDIDSVVGGGECGKGAKHSISPTTSVSEVAFLVMLEDEFFGYDFKRFGITWFFCAGVEEDSYDIQNR